MERTYKYLMILTFILNFTNIYSQSDNLISIWYDKAIHTLYLDKKLLESAANALSQYLGPLAPIILENLPYIVSFLALFFIFRRFLNIIDENLRMKNELSALMAAIGTYFFWPFVIPILIVALIIKAFRVGISKLERLKANLSKINSRLANLFSKTISDISNFNKNTDIILEEIDKLDKTTICPQIKRLIASIKNDVETSNNLIANLLKETECENLTLHSLSSHSSKFNAVCHNAKIKIGQLASILNNPIVLGRCGNKIFKPNKLTQKHLRELRDILQDLNTRLEMVHKEGQKIFGDLHGLLITAENISKENEKEMMKELNVIERDIERTPLPRNEKEKIEKNIQNLQIEVRHIDNKEPSPLKKLEIINKMHKAVKKAYISAEKLKKGPKGSPKNYVQEVRNVERLLKAPPKPADRLLKAPPKPIGRLPTAPLPQKGSPVGRLPIAPLPQKGGPSSGSKR